jgi:hypothetical protein
VPGKIGVGHFSQCRLRYHPGNGTQPGLLLRADPIGRKLFFVFHRVGSGRKAPQLWDLIGDADAISLNPARGAMLGAGRVFLQDVLKGSYAFSKRRDSRRCRPGRRSRP